MTKDQSVKLEAAIKAAGITNYIYVSDIPGYYLNNGKTAFTIADDTGVHSISKNGYAGAHNYLPTEQDICYYFTDFADIHTFMTAGSTEQMTKFLDSLGLDLTDEQVKILSWIGSVRNDIKPITGDYKFKKLSDEEYNKLDDDEKKKYNEAKKQYELEKAGISGKASISVQLG